LFSSNDVHFRRKDARLSASRITESRYGLAGTFQVQGAMPPTIAMRILGIDPGLRRTGWGVVTLTGNKLSYLGCGVVTTSSETSLAERLVQLHDGILAVIRAHRPDVAAVEQTFVNKDPVATLKLGQARAIALLVPAQAGLEVAEYAPNQVKKSVVGVGHAEKDQVHAMVKVLLPHSMAESADAADALAVAITHAHFAESNGRMAQLMARAR
jgi:crossover junction endodeoxyribonuclease RuvC